MIKKINQLNINYQITIWTMGVSFIVFILLLPFFFFSLMEIPLGFILGAFIASFFYFLFGLSENYDQKFKKPYFAILLIFLRLLIFLGLLFLLGYLYYEKNIKIFNVFLCAFGYIMAIIISIIINLTKKNKNENSSKR